MPMTSGLSKTGIDDVAFRVYLTREAELPA